MQARTLRRHKYHIAVLCCAVLCCAVPGGLAVSRPFYSAADYGPLTQTQAQLTKGMCWLLQISTIIFWSKLFAVFLAATDRASALLTNRPTGPNGPVCESVMECDGMPANS